MSKLQVYIPNSCLPERKYAIHLLFNVLLELPTDIFVDAQGTTQTRLVSNRHTWLFGDDFFHQNDPAKLYIKENLPTPIKGTGKLTDLVILFGEDSFEEQEQTSRIGFDIFASTFFMATRWEEILGPFDQHDRFLAASSIAFKYGFLNRPILHEYANWLQIELATKGISCEPQRTFKKIFTCDVDFPFYWDHNSLTKRLGAFVKKGIRFGMRQWQSYFDFKKDYNLDPYFTFGSMMDAAEASNLQVQFNFMTGGKTDFDGKYQITDPRIVLLIGEIKSRGHKVGLHGSYDSALNQDLLKLEKKALELVVGEEIGMSRQHFLRFKQPETWQKLNKAGISIDSTMGYADQPGFRCGLCITYPVFDIIERKQLNLKEQPLILMDATLRHYLSASALEGISVVKALTDQVAKHKGEFVFLWHNSSFSYDGYEELKPVYKSLIM